ncbi:hypothetical protein OSB04_014884 [Centaurea solstitialis]|uniref:Uncharacterized protein n=1 Tax=Centaurea solstitialis TaxID=347529 RepID=A0AA38SZI7_9ASTR|nr:hypothetical protein OSB04_014884 [Centaurea solstitialis]
MPCTSQGFAIVGYGFKRGVVPNKMESWMQKDLFKKLFKGKLCEPNVVVYNTMIKGLYKLGNNDSAIGWLRPWTRGVWVKLDPISWQGNPNGVAAMVVFDPLCPIKKGREVGLRTFKNKQHLSVPAKVNYSTRIT